MSDLTGSIPTNTGDRAYAQDVEEEVQGAEPLPPEPGLVFERPRGRRTPGLPKFTFPDSGITVELQRVGPDTLGVIQRAVAAKYPVPPPPVRETELGQEKNYADPKYKEQLQQHMMDTQYEIGARLLRLAILRMNVNVDAEAVRAYREQMEAIEAPIDPNLSDRDVYIRHLCLSSANDINALMAYLVYNSVPTPEVVAEHLEAFRDKI